MDPLVKKFRVRAWLVGREFDFRAFSEACRRPALILPAPTLVALTGLPQYQNSVRRLVGDLQWVRIPPGQSVDRPEATRATKDQAASVNKSSTCDIIITPPSRHTHGRLVLTAFEKCKTAWQ
jgi:hypothetical protein